MEKHSNHVCTWGLIAEERLLVDLTLSENLTGRILLMVWSINMRAIVRKRSGDKIGAGPWKVLRLLYD